MLSSIPRRKMIEHFDRQYRAGSEVIVQKRTPEDVPCQDTSIGTRSRAIKRFACNTRPWLDVIQGWAVTGWR